MVKVKEFACGCSVRTGALIILWTTLILDGIRSLSYFARLLYDPNWTYYARTAQGHSALLTIFLDMVFLTACTAGMAVSTFGLYAIQKRKPEFLNLCYYYYLGYTAYWVFIVLIIVIKPSFYYDVTVISPIHYFARYNGIERYTMVFALAYFFLAVFTGYMAVVLKSCKEYMVTNTEEGFDPEMPDPTTLGYKAAS
ncbi:uncharacterized protein LOC135834663 isoform X1 [Planococcus citri]|uniref:uncharacterized protein LOC135834663 isoform X1 n=1 Tax=Planococcus citri TaxID=170843 RepID=UPI0031F75EF8